MLLSKDTKYTPTTIPHEAMIHDIARPYVSNVFKGLEEEDKVKASALGL